MNTQDPQDNQKPFASSRSDIPSTEPAECRIVDIDMPFFSMVAFMVKWAIAAIPALIVLAMLGIFAAGFITSMFGPSRF